MAGPWLYAISKQSEKSFDLKDRALRATLQTYESLVRNGRLVEDRYWGIGQLWSHIDQGDEVFIYTGDENRGIIGYAHARDVVKRGERWAIDMDFDLSECKRLLRDPIPAVKVRDWVHYPRRNVIDLSEYEEELHDLLSHSTKVSKGSP